MVAYKLKLKLHIVFEERCTAGVEVIIFHHILIFKLQELLASCSTQQYQCLDTVCTHITDSGSNMQSTILTCTENPIQELYTKVSLSAPTVEVVSNWLPPLSVQTTDHEK